MCSPLYCQFPWKLQNFKLLLFFFVRGRGGGDGRILQRTFPESDPPGQKIDMNEFLTIKLELQVNT